MGQGTDRSSEADAVTAGSPLKRRLWGQLGPVIDRLSYSGVCFLDLEGVIVAVSDGVCAFLGYEEHELVGLPVDVLSTSEDRASGKLKAAMASVRRSGTIDNRRWALRKDGGRVLIEGPLLGLYDDDGTLTGFAEVMRNATQRAQTEQDLRDAEQRYRLLFDAIDEGFCILDVLFNSAGKPTAFSFVETNPAFHQLTGTTLEDARAHHVTRHDQEFWFTAAERVLDSGEPQRFEVTLRRQEPERTFDVRAWQLSGDASTQVAVIFKDITERKNFEAELRASAQRYQALFEFMPVAVYTCDADGALQDYNQRAVELWGREPNSGGITDKYCAAVQLHYSDGRPMPHEQCPTARALRGETLSPDDYELQIERPDGSIRNVGLYPRVLKDDKGRIIGAINNLHDYTEHARSEEVLQQNNAALELRVIQLSEDLKRHQARTRRAFDIAPAPCCLTTLDGNRILNVNQPFTKLLGYAPTEAIGRTTQELGLWSSQHDQATLNAGTRQEEGIDTYRELALQARTKNGVTRDILASGQTIEVNGQEVWLRLFIDVTERKRTEEELTAAIDEVMSDASWFSASVIQRLAELRQPSAHNQETIEFTRREQQVLKHIARGRSDTDIAADMNIARQTVRNYVANIYTKINVHTRAEAVVWARERGMLG